MSAESDWLKEKSRLEGQLVDMDRRFAEEVAAFKAPLERAIDHLREWVLRTPIERTDSEARKMLDFVAKALTSPPSTSLAEPNERLTRLFANHGRGFPITDLEVSIQRQIIELEATLRAGGRPPQVTDVWHRVGTNAAQLRDAQSVMLTEFSWAVSGSTISLNATWPQGPHGA